MGDPALRCHVLDPALWGGPEGNRGSQRDEGGEEPMDQGGVRQSHGL